jgi:hypothetical protein
VLVSTWREVAEAARGALALLGWASPDCLPGEPEECGGSDAEHAVAYLGALRAVVEYRITHLGPGARALIEETAARIAAELAAVPPGDQGHQEVTS